MKKSPRIRLSMKLLWKLLIEFDGKKGIEIRATKEDLERKDKLLSFLNFVESSLKSLPANKK